MPPQGPTSNARPIPPCVVLLRSPKLNGGSTCAGQQTYEVAWHGGLVQCDGTLSCSSFEFEAGVLNGEISRDVVEMRRVSRGVPRSARCQLANETALGHQIRLMIQRAGRPSAGS